MGDSLLSSFINLFLNSSHNDSNESIGSFSQVQNLFYLYDINPDTRKKLSAKGFKNIGYSEKEILENSSIVFNCVKPQHIDNIITNNLDYFNKDLLFISILAGINIEYMESIFINEAKKKNKEVVIPKIIRLMTNHLALIKMACSVYSSNKVCETLDEAILNYLVSNVGLIKKIDEKLMHSYTAFIGSSPAFIYEFIESFVDAGIKNGIDLPTARAFAIQTVIGSSRFVEEVEDKSPNNLKYIVSTPKGTTIYGLDKLHEHRFNYVVGEAITASAKRSEEIEKEKKLEIEIKYNTKI